MITKKISLYTFFALLLALQSATSIHTIESSAAVLPKPYSTLKRIGKFAFGGTTTFASAAGIIQIVQQLATEPEKSKIVAGLLILPALLDATKHGIRVVKSAYNNTNVDYKLVQESNTASPAVLVGKMSYSGVSFLISAAITIFGLQRITKNDGTDSTILSCIGLAGMLESSNNIKILSQKYRTITA